MSGMEASGGARRGATGTAFVVVLVVQLILVAAAGTDIPFHDQWDVEGRGLYPAMNTASGGSPSVFAAHNEHRIVWTHLLNRTLFALNGQWDPLVQLAVNAGLHALVAGALVWFLTPGLARRATWLLGAVVTLLALPVGGWHNALWGFQSQVYFAVGLAVVALGLLASAGGSWGRQVAGWFAAGAALLAMGPGLLVPAALAGWWLLNLRAGSARWASLGLALLLVAGAMAMHGSVPDHASLRAATVGEFFVALGRLLAWPHTGQPWAALGLNLPIVVLILQRLRTRCSALPGEDFVCALAVWAALVAVAAAWSRGGGEEFAAGVPSRYADLLMVLPLANSWCVVVLVGRAAARWRGVALAWGAFLFLGWAGLTAEVMRGVVFPRARDRDAPVRLVREFQRTGDAAVFAGQPRLLVPHPHPEAVSAVLADPRLSGALPPSLQPDQPMGPLSRGVRSLLGR